ncbi:hypothetical protein PILCRDRAFT_827034 [Piloderma croceum F 1598]|uniref:Uncharacterized protein n=1 Tax=Piloderma croceum (strain F 1598) TaxID=765440 RepID=A0A0C3APC9_PILCF|nr:hypothetical protein PILCRDRAFT_827034 [Piloderma croceum F 1598]
MQANLMELIKQPLGLLPFQTTLFSKYSSADLTSVHAVSVRVTRMRTLPWWDGYDSSSLRFVSSC